MITGTIHIREVPLTFMTLSGMCLYHLSVTCNPICLYSISSSGCDQPHHHHHHHHHHHPCFNLMQGIYNCISETNHVSRVYSVAAILYLQFVLHVMFCNYHYIHHHPPFPVTFPSFIQVDLQPSLFICICLPRASLSCYISIFFLPFVWQLFVVCLYSFELDFPFGHFS